MPLSPPAPRTLRHTRSIEVAAYSREDGLWDLDASIRDVKTRDIQLASGLRPGGTPVHDLKLRVTIDRAFNIVAADAASDAVPYPGMCNTIAPAYQALVGLNLMQHFRLHLKDRLQGVLGCTHLSELALVLPTAAVQAYANEVLSTQRRSACRRRRTRDRTSVPARPLPCLAHRRPGSRQVLPALGATRA